MFLSNCKNQRFEAALQASKGQKAVLRGATHSKDMVKVGDEEDSADALAGGRTGHADEEVHGCISHPLHAPIQLSIL